MPSITFTQVSLEMKSRKTLQKINLKFPHKNITGIIGPSGAGKSSLLGLINRLYEPSEGIILINDQNITDLDVLLLRKQIGMVFQKPIMFSGTVADNICYGPGLNSLWTKVERQSKVLELLNRVGLQGEMAERDATSLSGGEQQRVALARTLANEPEVLLLDEPTSALDLKSSQVIERVLVDLNKQNKITIIWVTHNLEQAKLTDYLVYLEAGQLVEFGPTSQIMQSPRQEATISFLSGSDYNEQN